MKFFERQPAFNVRSKINSLFSELAYLSNEEILCPDKRRVEFEHTEQIITAALNGAIDLEKPFNYRGYEYRCTLNDSKSKYSRVKKEIAIEFRDIRGSDKEDKPAYGTINSNEIKLEEEGYAEVDNEVDFECALRILCDLRNDFIIEQSFDILSVLSNALRGVRGAISALRLFCEKNEYLKEIVTSLLSSSKQEVLMVLEDMAIV